MPGRMIEVSTDVYAAIWGDRQPGEESEDDILARKFEIERKYDAAPEAKQPGNPLQAGVRLGWSDARHSVYLAEGFEIFRFYKGKTYYAVARNGFLIRKDTNMPYNSLNQLNRQIASGVENAWLSWHYVDANGDRQLLSDLRKLV